MMTPCLSCNTIDVPRDGVTFLCRICANPATVKIVGAAIWYEDVICSMRPPARHHNIIRKMSDLGLPEEAWRLQNQGFITNTGEFVDRYQACRIARAANQLIREPTPKDMLTSEDVW